MAPTSKDDNAILAAILKSFDAVTMKVDMTTLQRHLGYINVKSAQNTFQRMKKRYNLQVKHITLPAAGAASGSTIVSPPTSAKKRGVRGATATKQSPQFSSDEEKVVKKEGVEVKKQEDSSGAEECKEEEEEKNRGAHSESEVF